jgi:hypothetical protein
MTDKDPSSPEPWDQQLRRNLEESNRTIERMRLGVRPPDGDARLDRIERQMNERDDRLESRIDERFRELDEERRRNREWLTGFAFGVIVALVFCALVVLLVPAGHHVTP